MQKAGEFPDYARQSFQARSLLADPEKRADLIRLAKEGTSQGDIASYFYGGPGGKHPGRGRISELIKQLQDEGELQDYVPQAGTRNLSPDPYNYSTRGTGPEDPAWARAREQAARTGRAPGEIFQNLKSQQGRGSPESGNPEAEPDFAKALENFLRRRGDISSLEQPNYG